MPAAIKRITATPNAKRTKATATRSGRGRMSSIISGAVRPTVVPRGFALPVQLKNTMKYVEVLSTPLVVGATRFFIAANGMTTISTGAGTHKPLYFNELTALYNKYHVTASSIRVSFIAATGLAINDTFTLSVFLDDESTIVSVNALQERGTSRTSIVNGQTSVQRPIDPLLQTYSAAKMYGSTTMANLSLQGTAFFNPSDTMYYIISTQDQIGPSAGNAIVRVEVQYEVIWTDLKDVQQSS